MKILQYFVVALAFLLTVPAQADDRLPAVPYANINYAQLVDLLQKGGLLIDIRRPDEWQKTGVIRGSKTITLFDRSGKVQPDFFQKLKQAAPDPRRPVAVICRTGNRSRAGSQILKQLGYKRVYNVKNGITGWLREGLKVERYPASRRRER
ncbi:MAG: rhodanese-like domain-containing protein [Gammaproteobacteria bacterium]|nr:MAG: rhodanese-like domain-containing protein [Gammaproteobacteria bacterium]